MAGRASSCPAHTGPVTEPHVYPAHERPDVEVRLDDGTWAQGEALMRQDAGDTAQDRRYLCRWRRVSGAGTYTDWFPVTRVRLDTVDRSYGREC